LNPEKYFIKIGYASIKKATEGKRWQNEE